MLVQHTTKEDGQRIQPKNRSNFLQFNFEGFPERELEINASDSIQKFCYYLQNNLRIVRKFSKNNIVATYFNHDTLGQLSKEVRCREYPIDFDTQPMQPEFFKLGRQEVIWKESYSYEVISANQIRKKIANDAGIVYKEGICYTNSQKQLTEENNRFTATGVSEIYKYRYNADGKLIEKIFFSDVTGLFEEKTIFTYDGKGNVIQTQFYRNGKLLHESIYFYDKNGELPEAILTKYPDRSTIDMQQFIFEFNN